MEVSRTKKADPYGTDDDHEGHLMVAEHRSGSADSRTFTKRGRAGCRSLGLLLFLRKILVEATEEDHKASESRRLGYVPGRTSGPLGPG